MSTGIQNPRDLSSLAGSLRDHLESIRTCTTKSPPPPAPELLEQVLHAVEELTSYEAPTYALLADGHQPLSTDLSHAIDARLAQWQAQIITSYEQAALRGLADQFDSAQRLIEDLQQRELHLNEQMVNLESRLAEVLAREARTQRQRIGLAAELRARRAEGLLDVELARDALRAQLQTELREELQAEQAETLERLERQTRTSEQLQTASDQLQTANEQLRSANQGLLGDITTLKQSNVDLTSELAQAHSMIELEESEQSSRLVKLQKDLTEARAEVELTREELASKIDASQLLQESLADARQQITELETNQADQAAHSEEHELLLNELEKAREEVEQLQSQLSQHVEQTHSLEELREQLQWTELQLTETRDELVRSRENASEATGLDAVAASELSELQSKLTDMQAELQQLHEENERLIAEKAELQSSCSAKAASNSLDQESLSWEERKKLIMQQLESEGDDECVTTDRRSERMEIERVIESTEREIEARDRQIEELQSIIEQQADTKQGVAIGAAAIAQMFDTDELIQQEREKLKAIQNEWEEKLRKAEIDVSMERAKLARERLQLESEREQIHHDNKRPPQAAPEVGQARTRKWLEHLGLKEDRQGNA